MVKRSAALVIFVAIVWAGVSQASAPGTGSRPVALSGSVEMSVSAVQSEAGQTIAATGVERA